MFSKNQKMKEKNKFLFSLIVSSLMGFSLVGALKEFDLIQNVLFFFIGIYLFKKIFLFFWELL